MSQELDKQVIDWTKIIRQLSVDAETGKDELPELSDVGKGPITSNGVFC